MVHLKKMMSMGVTDHLSEKTRGKKMEERELKKHIQEKKMNFLSDRDATASYHKEQKWLKLLAQGRMEELEYPENSFGPENLYTDAVLTYRGDHKQMEYNLVACITLACRPVITAGVDPFEAYRISDIYLQQLSECTELKDMMWVAGTVMGEFNELAKTANPENREASIDVENAKTYICRHLQEKLTMQEVCRAVGVSSGYLSKKFRESGTTFREYVMEERLKRSANLLAQTEEPVSVISDYFSFASPSYFSSCFHRQYQMTPLEYRKRHKFQCN